VDRHHTDRVSGWLKKPIRLIRAMGVRGLRTRSRRWARCPCTGTLPLSSCVGMRVAFALAGTDKGRSGIGVYLREVLPRLRRRLSARGDSLVAFGSAEDFAAYADLLDGTERIGLPSWLDRPGASALFHLAFGGLLARRAR